MTTNKKKHRGMLALVLGVLLMAAGGILLTQYGGRLEYILPAPAATQEGGELNTLYEDAQKQIAAIADSIEVGAVGARLQGTSLTMAESGSSMQTTIYAVGSGYFDVVHETLLNGRLVSEADVKRKENVIVIDESTALAFFAGDDPLGGKVTLDGTEYEVAGVIKGAKRLGETDGHVAYIPITAASENALTMQTVEIVAKTTDSTTGSAILMRDSLEAWQSGGSFYNYNKLTMGAAMPLRWIALFVGAALLLSLLSRLNAVSWGRICYYTDQLKTRYARDMFWGMAASVLLCLLGYAALAGATFLLARFVIAPLYVFTEWVPEIIVEMKSITSRFWSLNAANSASIRLVSCAYCVTETGQGLLRWGIMAALLGMVMNGIPFFSRNVEMPVMKKER